MASMCGKRLKYLRNGLTMLEITKEFENSLYMWVMTYIPVKWLKFLRNDKNIWKMT